MEDPLDRKARLKGELWPRSVRPALCAMLSSPKFSMDDVYSHLTQGAVMLTEDKWFTKVSSLRMEIGSKCTPVCLHSLCSFRSDVMGYITEGTKRVDVFPPPPPSKGGFKITTGGLAQAGFKWEWVYCWASRTFTSYQEKDLDLFFS